ncbi:hypothetical protein K0U91_10770 [Chryseobacterium chendengshani]|uniref:hypothetical protein n=1 Tax=Chryseobacterium sp. LJ668 TaxID=2864040 RepID=UPI001C6933F9|nr:hypothetical protein [Chryseobacterium sp. LJ668]MBW8523252.1 hypothetical protein [Chryseobacterium sp. LJ668]QYK15545.1 hypothetical protein K0U91_10770 [Chryseobacterium sp. LJ668]
MKIKKLEKLTSNPTLNWEFNSYEIDKIFSVSSIEIGNTFEFSLKVKISTLQENLGNKFRGY